MGPLPLFRVCVLTPVPSVPVPAEPTPLKLWQWMNCRGGLFQTGRFAVKEPNGFSWWCWRCAEAAAVGARAELQRCPTASHAEGRQGDTPTFPSCLVWNGGTRRRLRSRSWGSGKGSSPACFAFPSPPPPSVSHDRITNS